MSNDGMPLNVRFRFQISNLSLEETQPSGIGLSDFDISLLNSNVDRGRASAVDDLINVHAPRGRIRPHRGIVEIIHDLSMRSVGEQVESCSGWQKGPGVSLSDIYLRRKRFVFPPIVRERERPPVHCEVQIRETVPGENPAVAQPCVHFSSADTV